VIILKDKKNIIDWFRVNSNIIFPTETVYGLGAKANDPIGIKNIYKIKNRPITNPLIIHFSSISQIEEYCDLTPIEKKILETFTPGPITLMLRKKNINDFKEATINSPKVCCRIPHNLMTLELIKHFGPIAGPSANLSGELTITNKHMLENSYGHMEIGVFLDDENVKGIESTIIEIVEDEINILREGIINKDNLLEFLEKNHLKHISINKIKNNSVIVPGNHFPHYQIKKNLKISENKLPDSFHISYGNNICDFNLSKNNNPEEIIKNYFYSLFLGDLSKFPHVTIKNFPEEEVFASLKIKLNKTLNKN
jgi:L-threonylcarbamoyladenylate synthase